MLSASARRLAVASLLFLPACRGSDWSAAPPSAAEDGGAPSLVITLTVADDFTCAGGGICALPSQSVVVTVGTTRDTTVSLAIEGGYGDAALSADHVTTVGGQARVTLQTSSSPAAFTLVGHVANDPSSPGGLLPVAVGTSGFAVLRISPTYDATRPSPSFLTSVTRSSCAAVATIPPAEITWLPTPVGTQVIVPVPAEQPFAVSARIEEYATGCQDVSPLAASVTHDVGIDVYDVPMALDLTDMNASFEPDTASTTAWKPALARASSAVSARFFPSSPDGEPLLDAIRTRVPTADLTAFDSARAANGWNDAADAWLAARTPGIHDRASTWLTAAAGSAIGDLVVHLGVGTAARTAAVTPAMLGPIGSALADLSAATTFTWTAAADDTVHLAGSFSIDADPFVGHLADTLAASEVSTTNADVASVIAARIDCTGLSSSLLGTDDAYGACDATCFAALCGSAIEAEWAAALAPPADHGDILTLAVTVGAPGEVGADAEPSFVEGSWTGQVAGAGAPSSFQIGGTFVAAEVVGATP